MRKFLAVMAAVLVLAGTAACPKPPKKCEPGSMYEDIPDNPGVYYVCVDTGTGWLKVESPAATPKSTKK